MDQDPTHITALALDQCPPESLNHLRIATFLSSGKFSIFIIDHVSPKNSARTMSYVPAAKTNRTSPIIQAVYHHPLLITLSQVFHLSIYDLSSDTISHKQTLTSFTSFPPTSLVLSAPSAATYKLVLAYAIPVYPVHWSVGATELIISGSQFDADAKLESLEVITTRTARAFDVPIGWLDESKLRSLREQWGRKVPGVADTQTDGKWVVLAPATATTHSSWSAPPSPLPSASNSGSGLSSAFEAPHTDAHPAASLQLYRLSFPFHHSSSSIPKLTFVRHLFGQIGPVIALSLADGRCVSLSANGSVWVWDLDAGTGTEVSPTPGVDRGGSPAEKIIRGIHGPVAFDERRIITAGPEGVVVRRFDS
jgi:hypothetical protein